MCSESVKFSLCQGDTIRLPGSTISLVISDEESQPLLGSGSTSQEDGNFRKHIIPCLAEFSGTMMFVFIGTMASYQDGVHVALAHGLAIFLLVSLFGHISGGHFNPAVTFGVTLSGGLCPMVAVGYVVSQLTGGIVGAAFTRCVLDYTYPPAGQSLYILVNGGATLSGDGVAWWQGLLVEIIFTAFLVFTVLMTAVDQKQTLAPLAIGLALGVSILAGGPVSGCSLNPARSLGPSVVGTDLISGLWRYHYIYWIGPLIGAAIAAMEFKLIYASPENRYKKFR